MSRHSLIAILLVFQTFCALSQSWQQALETKRAKLKLFWYTSVPFIYQEQGNLKGVEKETFELFGQYIADKHKIDLDIEWVEQSSFPSIMSGIQEANRKDIIGVSAFSITNERKKNFTFTEPYLPDVTVLVSSPGTPIISSNSDFIKMIRDMEAVTIKGTTYESLLLELQDELKTGFKINYIDSDNNILETIKLADNRFGFIDLPIYLMLIKNGGALTRQNFFTVIGTGYGFLMSKNSDWNVPLNAFLADPKYQSRLNEIKSRYLGTELFTFIDQLDEQEELSTSLLTKEKEIQLALIKNANLKLQESDRLQRVLIIGIVIITAFLLVIAFLFINNRRYTQKLTIQKNQIESQQQDIGDKNEQLQNRNKRLIQLNEDKNHLMKILAHDLRSPLSQIIGFSDVLQSNMVNWQEDQKEILQRIVQSSSSMEAMITKILDTNNAERPEMMILREQVQVKEIIDNLVNRYSSNAQEKQIVIRTAFNADQIILETDHIMLFLILENLLTNAIKYSGRKTEILLKVNAEPSNVIFEVKDQGPGLSKEDQAKAFRRFQKLSATPTGNEPSIGLGLSIVKKYVSDLHGKVWIESEVGKGSSFFVSLPSNNKGSIIQS